MKKTFENAPKNEGTFRFRRFSRKISRLAGDAEAVDALGRRGMRALLSVMSALAIAIALFLPTTMSAKAGHRVHSNPYATVDFGRYHGPRHYRAGRYYAPRHRYRAGRYYGPRHRHHRRHRGSSFSIIIGGGAPHHYRPAPRYIAPPVIPARPVYRLTNAHINWCHARYRSYRVSDNSFQPYHGPRKACISPYR